VQVYIAGCWLSSANAGASVIQKKMEHRQNNNVFKCIIKHTKNLFLLSGYFYVFVEFIRVVYKEERR
jgi:hypothetical protein